MKHKSDDGGGGGGSVVEVTAAVAPFCVTALKGEGGDGSGVTLRGFFIIITSHGGEREREVASPPLLPSCLSLPRSSRRPRATLLEARIGGGRVERQS